MSFGLIENKPGCLVHSNTALGYLRIRPRMSKNPKQNVKLLVWVSNFVATWPDRKNLIYYHALKETGKGLC